MTNKLASQPTHALSILGKKIPHIYKCDGVILCDFEGISALLGCSFDESLQSAAKHDRLTVFEKQVYCTADDFAFWVDEMPQASSLAKEIAKKIHTTSTTALLHYFLFNYQK